MWWWWRIVSNEDQDIHCSLRISCLQASRWTGESSWAAWRTGVSQQFGRQLGRGVEDIRLHSNTDACTWWIVCWSEDLQGLSTPVTVQTCITLSSVESWILQVVFWTSVQCCPTLAATYTKLLEPDFNRLDACFTNRVVKSLKEFVNEKDGSNTCMIVYVCVPTVNLWRARTVSPITAIPVMA